MANTPPKRKSGTPDLNAGRDASSRQFVETVERMRRENTASPEIARSKLKELGILTSDGRLSDKYK